VVDFGLDDVVPHVVARETHQRPQEFSLVSPKRLLQQYLPQTDISKDRSSNSGHQVK